jgi:alanine racemase
MTRPACAIIDTQALRFNLQRVRSLAPGRRVMAIVKADAYGHGLESTARHLNEADAFGVACLEEAVRLRDAGVVTPVILLEGPFAAQELDEIQRLHLETVVHDYYQLEMIERARFRRAIRVWLKIDTGMHRLGFPLDAVPDVLRRLEASQAVQTPPRLMTHFANTQQRGDPSVTKQLENYQRVTKDLPGEHCLANSAGIIAWPETHGDWVRPGLMLYGVSPFNDTTSAEEGLKPVMTLRSEIIAVRRLHAGERVGYGGTWECPEEMPVGILAMGYGDGYPRHASVGTPVLVNGRRAALIGKASMDMLAVDLRLVPDAQVGDPVELWGENLPVEEIARHASTIPYELLCSVRSRVRFIEKTAF